MSAQFVFVVWDLVLSLHHGCRDPGTRPGIPEIGPGDLEAGPEPGTGPRNPGTGPGVSGAGGLELLAHHEFATPLPLVGGAGGGGWGSGRLRPPGLRPAVGRPVCGRPAVLCVCVSMIPERLQTQK
jgi:hypothetical protein